MGICLTRSSDGRGTRRTDSMRHATSSRLTRLVLTHLVCIGLLIVRLVLAIVDVPVIEVGVAPCLWLWFKR